MFLYRYLPLNVRGTRGFAWRRARVSGSAIALSLTLVLLTACGGGGGKAAQSSGGLVKVAFNEYQATPYSWLLNFTAGKGFFKRNGIDAQITPTPGGAPSAFAALAGGTLQFASGDMINGGVVMDQGTQLQAVAGLMKGNQSTLVGSKNGPTTFPEGVEALKGKPVGVVSVGSAAYYYMQMFLSAAKVDPNAVQYVAVTAQPASLVSALESGKVAATWAPLPTAYALSVVNGYPVLFTMDSATTSLFPGKPGDPTAVPKDSPLGVLDNRVHQYLWATKKYAEGNPEIVKKVQLSLMEADVWLHNPKNLNEAIQYLVDSNEAGAFPGETPEQLNKLLAAIIPFLVAYVPPEDVKAFQDQYVKIGALKKTVPLNDFLRSDIPADPSAVVSKVKAAGAGDLGDSA